MSLQIVVPSLGESISEATVLKWFKKVGEKIEADEPLVELETDKVTVEVPAPASGILKEIFACDGEDVAVGGLLGSLEDGALVAGSPAAAGVKAPTEARSEPVLEPTPVTSFDAKLSPAVRKLVDDNMLDPVLIPATGKKGQLTKADVEAHIATGVARPASASAPSTWSQPPCARR